MHSYIDSRIVNKLTQEERERDERDVESSEIEEVVSRYL